MSIYSQVFSDSDQFAASFRGFDSRMLVNNATRHEWRTELIDLDDVIIQMGRLGSGNIVEGQTWRNMVAIYLPLTPSIAYLANAREARQWQPVVVEPNTDVCMATTAAHDWAGIFVNVEALASGEASPTFSAKSLETYKGTCRIIIEQAEVISWRILTNLQQVMLAASRSSRFANLPGSCAAAQELIASVRSVWRFGSDDCRTALGGRPAISRTASIAAAKEAARKAADRKVNARELATAVGASERTLRKVFNEYFGVGPSRYFRLQQLHDVRSVLREADPMATTVGDILAACGVWEFGRFASLYKSSFGELPSETLRSRSTKS